MRVSIRIQSLPRDRFVALEQAVREGQPSASFVEISFAGRFTKGGGDLSPVDLMVATKAPYGPVEIPEIPVITLEMLGEALAPTGLFPRATPVIQRESILQLLEDIERKAAYIRDGASSIIYAREIAQVVQRLRSLYE